MTASQSIPTLSTILIKVASRCNLACDYCYMYEHADQSWRHQPPIMSAGTVMQLVQRLSNYIEIASLPDISLILHGGEPLLAGLQRCGELFRAVRNDLPRHCKVDLAVQTNGTLLSSAWLDLFDRWDVSVSVSLDGGQSANDRHRRTHTGRSSYEAVAEGLAHIHAHPAGKRLFTGILGVIDLANDPAETYEHLASFGAPSLDFLSPDGTYEDLPPGLTQPGVRDSDAPYGHWLAHVFDQWYADRQSVTGIRLFENIMDLLLGGSSRTEGVGPGFFSILTVETDGQIQDVDVMKVAFEGAPRLGEVQYSVHDHEFAQVLSSPEVTNRASLVGQSGLCKTCLACPLVDTCGGGHLPHRYRRDTGFDNPSVYCGDLAHLIRHIRNRVSEDISLLRGRAT